jgi:hypothetical protein
MHNQKIDPQATQSARFTAVRRESFSDLDLAAFLSEIISVVSEPGAKAA